MLVDSPCCESASCDGTGAEEVHELHRMGAAWRRLGAPLQNVVLVLDGDGTLMEVGKDEPVPVALAAVEAVQAGGGTVIMLSGRAEPHLRRSLRSVGLFRGLGECGYVEIDGERPARLLVPSSFYRLYCADDQTDATEVMRSIGVNRWILGLSAADLGIAAGTLGYSAEELANMCVFESHRNSDRRATLCLRAPRAFIDVPLLQAALDREFGPGLVAFTNGKIGDRRLRDGILAPLETLHIAPATEGAGLLAGKALALKTLVERSGPIGSDLHFGGDSDHDREAAMNAGVRFFGVGNCSQPELWTSAGAVVMTSDHGYGVAEYVRTEIAARVSGEAILLRPEWRAMEPITETQR